MTRLNEGIFSISKKGVYSHTYVSHQFMVIGYILMIWNQRNDIFTNAVNQRKMQNLKNKTEGGMCMI